MSMAINSIVPSTNFKPYSTYGKEPQQPESMPGIDTSIVIRLQTTHIPVSHLTCHAQRKWEHQSLRRGVETVVGTLVVKMISSIFQN